MKPKDAYDLYYCLSRDPQGIEGLASELQSMVTEKPVQTALARIGEKFSTIDSVGPVWAAQIVQSAGGDYEMTRRDAFERVNAMLAAIEIPL
jgi:hypothetical protein